MQPLNFKIKVIKRSQDSMNFQTHLLLVKDKQIDWFTSFNNESNFLMHVVAVGNSMPI